MTKTEKWPALNDMNRDFVWFVIVIILGGNTLVMLNSEDNNPNLIDIEELTCSLGEIMVSNVSLGA